jgi:hypothetical protein
VEGKGFPYPSLLALGYTEYLAICGVKRSGSVVNHIPQTSAEVRKYKGVPLPSSDPLCNLWGRIYIFTPVLFTMQTDTHLTNNHVTETAVIQAVN